MALYPDYKEFFEREFELEYHDIHAVREQINELITALEAARAELAEANVKIRRLEETIWTHGNAPIGNESEHENERDTLIDNLRTQLAEAQAKLAEYTILADNHEEHIDQLCKQLAASQAEVERLLAEARAVTKGHKVCKDCDILRQELAASQAEVERLQKRDAWLTCLEQAGVDNWVGIEFAYENYKQEATP